MLKIGITGGIGSGKSLVCRAFSALGIPVYLADTQARGLMNTLPELRQGIAALFGPDIFLPAHEQDASYSGPLDRERLARIIFHDSAALQRVNQLVHPAVHTHFEQWAAQQPNVPYVLKEAAILFESGSYRLADYSILVLAPTDLRLRRVLQRDRTEAQHVQARMQNQWTDEQKIPLASFLLHNDGQQLLLPQIEALHAQLLQLAAEQKNNML